MNRDHETKDNSGEDSEREDFNLEGSRIFTAFRPLIIVSRALGSYYVPKNNNNGEETKSKWWFQRFDFWIVYCVFIGCLQFIDLAKVVYSLRDLKVTDGNLYFDISLLLSPLVKTVVHFFFFYVTYKYSLESSTLLKLLFLSEKQTDHKEETLKKVKKFTKLACFILVFHVITNALFHLFLLVKDASMLPKNVMFGARHPGYKVLNTIYETFLCAVGVNTIYTPMLFLCIIICGIITHEFEEIKDYIITNTSRDGIFNGDLESQRMRHVKLCQLIDDLDDLWKYFISIVLVCDLIQVTAFTHALTLLIKIGFEERLLHIITALYWIAVFFFNFAVVTMGCGTLSAAVTAPLNALHSITICNERIDKKAFSMQLSYFISRMNAPPTGFTFMGMFVVDKNLLLTILSIMLTYFLIMYQLVTSTTLSNSVHAYYDANSTNTTVP